MPSATSSSSSSKATRGWPTPAECRLLFSEVGLDPRVVAHVEAVAALARTAADLIGRNGHAVDRNLVEAGALLHDVGRSQSHGIDHAAVGGRMLRDRGFPEELCRVVERHTGGGIDAEEARQLGLPATDYTPQSLEERIVCGVDNLVDGDQRQKVSAEIAALKGKGLERAADKVQSLHEELSALAGRDLDTIG